MSCSVFFKVIRSVICLLILMAAFSISKTVYCKAKIDNNTKNNSIYLDVGEKYAPDFNTIIRNNDICFKIPVQKGHFYKLSIKDIEMGSREKDFFEDDIIYYDFNDPSEGCLNAYLVKDGDDEYDSFIDSSIKRDLDRIFRANYTGYYYLYISNIYLTKFSIQIHNYNPIGRIVSEYDGATYRITGLYSVELIKDKNIDGKYYINGEPIIDQIEGVQTFEAQDQGMMFKTTSIGVNAFRGEKISSVCIPETVKKIGKGAFQNCKKLGSAEIYGTKIIIGAKAFYGCKSLKSIYIYKWASVKSVKKNAFKGTSKRISIKVPSIKKYRKILKKAGFRKPKYLRSY